MGQSIFSYISRMGITTKDNSGLTAIVSAIVMCRTLNVATKIVLKKKVRVQSLGLVMFSSTDFYISLS